MPDPDPIPLPYSGRRRRPPRRGSGPGRTALDLLVWTLAVGVLVGLPVTAAILATTDFATAVPALLVLVALVPLVAAAARGFWSRYSGAFDRTVPDHPLPPVREAVSVLVNGVGWTILATLGLLVPLGLVALATGPILFFPALVVLVLSVPLWGAGAAALRRRRALAVLGYLEQAVRLNQPLDRMVAAAARGERGRLRARLEDLFLALQGGMAMADAVAVAVPEVPPRSVGALAYAEANGRPADALRRLIDDDRRRGGGRTPEARAFAAWYPPLVLLVATAIVALIGVFVMPKFVYIFHDFRIPLPRLTHLVWGTVIDTDRVLYVLPVLALVAIVTLGQRLREALHGGRPSWLLQGLRDRLWWHLPVLGSAHRDRSLADLCHALADAVEGGLPLDAAVVRAQRLGLNAVLLRGVAHWAGAMDRGVAPADAARAARLPPLVVGLVGSLGTDPPAAAAALRFAARFYDGRHAARRAVLAAAYVPAVTLALGLVVAVLALSLMLPLRNLIEHLAPYPVAL